jgi:hypothetical protein
MTLGGKANESIEEANQVVSKEASWNKSTIESNRLFKMGK